MYCAKISLEMRAFRLVSIYERSIAYELILLAFETLKFNLNYEIYVNQ